MSAMFNRCGSVPLTMQSGLRSGAKLIIEITVLDGLPAPSPEPPVGVSIEPKKGLSAALLAI